MRYVDRPFDWVAALAFAAGVAVIVPSIVAVGIALLTVIMSIV